MMHVSIVKKAILASGMTSALILVKNGQDNFFPFEPRDHKEKMLMVNAFRAVAAQIRADMAILTCEAWAVSVKTPKDQPVDIVAEREKMAQNLADEPGRVEIQVIQIERRGKPCETHIFEIKRNPDGSLAELADSSLGADIFESNLWILEDPRKAAVAH